MNQQLRLEIVTPQRILLETEAEYIALPGEMGQLGVLPSHIPVLTNLESGVLSYQKDGVEKKLAVHYGYAEICQDKITILAKLAELAEEIDIERAKKSQAEAEEKLASAMKAIDQVEVIDEMMHKIQKAATRLNAAQS